MQSFLILALGFALANGQASSVCDGTCLYPATNPTCKQVTLYSQGVDPWKSPYYAISSSSMSIVQELDSRCSTFFHLSKALFLLVNILVYKNGSYMITKSLRADIDGSPGANRLEGITTDGCSSCVYNDFTLGRLNETCDGTYVLYRCPLYGDCVSQNEKETVLSFSTTLPVPSCCHSRIESLAQQQGFGSLPLYCFPNKLGSRCVTRLYGLTAINADCVDPAVSVEIKDD